MTMDVVRTDVLVVGAGPTGQTLACSLARAGVSFHLIDKIEKRSPYSRALVVHLRSLEIFNQLGMADELLSYSNNVKGVRAHAGRKLKFEARLADLLRFNWAGCRYKGVLVVEQDRTEAVLDKALEQMGSKPLFSHELIDYEEDADGVRARCRDDKGQEYAVECKYIAGCDGAHSVVRHKTRIPFVGDAYEDDFMLADLDVEWDQPGEFIQLFIDQKGILVLAPMFKKTRLIASLGRYIEDVPDPTLEDFQRLVDRLVPYKAKLSNATWLTRFRLHHRIANRFRQGRSFLAGDAAHIHSPAGGQGMNTGIQDGWNLGWKLAWALRCEDAALADELLESYNEERHPVGEALIQTTDRMFKLMTGQTWFSGFMRRWVVPTVIPLVTRITPLVRLGIFRITQLGIGYRGQSLCGPDPDSGHFVKGVQPGDRMPDLELNGVSLHSLLDPRWPTVLSVGMETTIDSPKCKSIQLANPTDEQRSLLGVRASGVFLIRPDAHLAARAATGETIQKASLLRLLPD